MKNPTKILGITIGIAAIVSLVLLIWYPFLSAFRIGLGSFFILFLPGFIWTYSLKLRDIDQLTRIVFSFALSIIIIPMITFYVDYADIPITALSIFTELLIIDLIGIAIIGIRILKSPRHHS